MLFYSILLLASPSVILAKAVPELPVITSAPSPEDIDLRVRQNPIDIASLAQVLVTAVPPSILGLALTNVPAVSRLLWSEFLDDNTPAWFTALPTDIQQYLSGEFGPTTAPSITASSTNPSSRSIENAQTTTSSTTTSETAASSNTDSEKNADHGLPLWAKITIGVVVPLVVLGIVAFFLVCCIRRRRRRRRASLGHASSRTPTPAFISSSNRATATQPPGEQHVPLRGGHQSSQDLSHLSQQTTRSSIGGPSYEEIPAAVPFHQPNRGSRQSFGSLHSVPEVPEPMHNRYDGAGGPIPMPPPPRSPRRSQDTSNDSHRRWQDLDNGANGASSKRISPLNPIYNDVQANMNQSHPADPYRIGQGIYAGGNNPYPSSSYMPYRSEGHSSNPFEGSRRGQDSDWPLSPQHDDGFRAVGGDSRTKGSYDRIYEM